MRLLFLALTLLAVQPFAQRAAPAKLAWDKVSSEAFDLRWRLPARPGGSEHDLVSAMKQLAAKRVETGAPTWARSFGDIVTALAPLSPAGRAAKIAELSTTPWRADLDRIVALVSDEQLATSDWDPSDATATDGFVEGTVLDVSTIDRQPWSDLDGATRLHQVATLMDADIESIKAAENDFDSYLTRRFSSYEEIDRVPRSYRIGTTPTGGPFAVIDVRFECDLPFPFTGYEGTLRGISTLSSEGHLVTDFYVVSDDFYWMAGRDSCVPVRDARGAWVSTIFIRQAGFDLIGVPEGDDDRVTGTRTVLGNVKERAESIDAQRTTPPVAAGSIPRVR